MENVSHSTGIALPSETDARSVTLFGGRFGNAKILNDSELETFANETKWNIWLSSLPPASKGLLPDSFWPYVMNLKRFFVYLPSDGVFNPTNVAPGKYSVIFVGCDVSQKKITVLDLYKTDIKY